MKSTIIFLLIASASLVWTVQQRTTSDKVLFQADQGVPPIQVSPGEIEVFEFECMSFAFFDSLRIQRTPSINSSDPEGQLQLRIQSHDPEDRLEQALWSKGEFNLKRGVMSIQEFKPEQEGDPWWEKVCSMHFQLTSDTKDSLFISHITLSRNSSGNFQVLLGLIGLLWLLAIGFFILRKLFPHLAPSDSLQEDSVSSEGAKDQNDALAFLDSEAPSVQLPPLEDPQEEEWWLEIQQVLVESYADPEFSLKALAEEMKLRQKKVDEIFRAKVKISFETFLLELRLHHSSKLLMEFEGQSLEVYEKVGFKSLRQFNKAFKVKFNKSPEKFYLTSEESS